MEPTRHPRRSNPTGRILVVEDDREIAKLLIDTLTAHGFAVRWAKRAAEATAEYREFAPDLVLLEITLPDRSGFDLCGMFRQAGRPVIIVSALNQRKDKLRGLELGADDYVTKPFDIDELVARIQAVLRRASHDTDAIRLGDLHVDFKRMKATGPQGPVHLTSREFRVLQYLWTHQHRTVFRHQLLLDVWGVIDGSSTRAVDFAIRRLRQKIERDPRNPQFIRTIRGDGYCLTPETTSGRD